MFSEWEMLVDMEFLRSLFAVAGTWDSRRTDQTGLETLGGEPSGPYGIGTTNLNSSEYEGSFVVEIGFDVVVVVLVVLVG